MDLADQTLYFTQSQYTNTAQTSPSADPITQGAWQGSRWSARLLSHQYNWTRKKDPHGKLESKLGLLLEVDALTTRPMRQSKTTELVNIYTYCDLKSL